MCWSRGLFVALNLASNTILHRAFLCFAKEQGLCFALPCKKKKRIKMAIIFDKYDLAGIILIFALMIATVILIKSQAIDTSTGAIIFLMLLTFPIAKNTIPTIIVMLQLKKIYGKSTADYWNETKKEINNSYPKHGFNYDFQLPDDYAPLRSIELPEYDVVLFEINLDDLKNYFEEMGILQPSYKIITIIHSITGRTIKGIIAKNLESTHEYIEQHIDSFKTIGKKIILPEYIKETKWGEPIPTTETQPKK